MKLTKEFLDSKYEEFLKIADTIVDPKDFLSRYTKQEDKEIVALIASSFSMGHISSFMKKIQLILNELGTSPSETLLDDKKFFVAYENVSKIKHRFLKGGDLQSVLNSFRSILLLNRIFGRPGFLGDILKNKIEYCQHYNLGYQVSAKEILILLRDEIFKHIDEKDQTRSLKLMFPDPSKGSACKRWLLFLRWMVRFDGIIDRGHWQFIPTSTLVIPCDVHIFNIAQRYKLTTSTKNNWDTAVEITESLKEFDKEDPVRWDFVFCHLERLGKLDG